METEMKTISIDEGYGDVEALLVTAQTVINRVKPEFEPEIETGYNPFESFKNNLETETSKLREHLIDMAAAKYRNQYMPNAKPDVNFKKLMDTEAGKREFSDGVIKRWFEKATANREGLALQCLRHLQQEASPLIPSGTYEGEWGKPKHPEILVKGRFLRLHAYTWDTQFKSVSAYRMWEPLEALDKLISVGTGKCGLIDAESMLNLRVYANTREPLDLYKKTEVKHPTVKSFRFYKNDSFEIEFKEAIYALAAAKLLVSPKPFTS